MAVRPLIPETKIGNGTTRKVKDEKPSESSCGMPSSNLRKGASPSTEEAPPRIVLATS